MERLKGGVACEAHNRGLGMRLCQVLLALMNIPRLSGGQEVLWVCSPAHQTKEKRAEGKHAPFLEEETGRCKLGLWIFGHPCLQPGLMSEWEGWSSGGEEHPGSCPWRSPSGPGNLWARPFAKALTFRTGQSVQSG